jgi:hypothetical protein
MARLCILREDLMLELRGIYAERIVELDEHSEQWRRIYFLRRSVASLWEIQGAVNRIRADKRFKAFLRTRTATEQRELKEITKKLNEAAPMIQRLRHAFGGHVDTNALAHALDNMNSERFGLIEVGPIIKATHFKIAGELVTEMMVSGVPEKDRETQVEREMKVFADLLPIVHRMEVILMIYEEARGVV